MILNIVIYIVAVIISITLGAFMFYVGKNSAQLSELEKTNKKRKIANKIFSTDRYLKLQLYLSQKGVNYMMKRVVDPIEWIVVKILCSVLIGISLYGFIGIFGSIIGLIIAFYIPNIIIYMSNKDDNKKMLVDIKNMYETLKIKTESGIFITDSLLQCFRVAKNSRLKSEMLVLINEIKVKNDIMGALSNFENKFDNKYIIGFTGVIRQGFDTDDIKSSIDNISKQMNSVQRTLDIRADEAVAKNAGICQVVILIEIMLVVAYALIQLGSSMINVFL